MTNINLTFTKSKTKIPEINPRYSRWLQELKVIKLSKQEDDIARLIASGEFVIEDIIAPLYESGKMLPEKQLSSSLLRAFDLVRKKVTAEFEDKYGKAKKNPAGSLSDQRQARDLAQSYKDQIQNKIDNGMTKKEAIESMLTSWKSIAATESVRIVNEQRDFLLGSYSGTKTWNAVLDHKTCLLCKSLNGMKTKSNTDFKYKGKTITPPVHPYCRCFTEYNIDVKK